MGLLDNLGNSFGNMTSDPRQMGLLMAAAQMMAQSGPSNRPVGLGEIMGGGLSTFLNTKNTMQQQQADAQEREQAQQYRGMQMQGMEQQQQAAQAALQRSYELQDHIAKFKTPKAAMLGKMNGPTVQNAEMLQQAPQQETPYQRYLGMAQHLRADPRFEAEAREYDELALKFAPKVDKWQPVKVNGRVLLKPYYADGTAGEPVTADVAEKLEFRTIGGKTIGVDSYSGDTVSTYNHTMTHGEKNARDRLNYDREQADAPTFSADLGGFVSRPSKANPQGGFTPLAGTPSRGPKITEFQGKSGAFGLRATEADKIITGLNGKYSPARVNAKISAQDLPLVGGISGVIANNLLSEGDQQAEQAQRDFINAILRQESGASIGIPEFDNARLQYFPQPGDSPAVILQKERNRQLAIQGLNQNAGPAAMTAPVDQPKARKYNPATGRIE